MVMMKTSTNNNKKTTSKLKTCKLQLNLISKNNLVRKLITFNTNTGAESKIHTQGKTKANKRAEDSDAESEQVDQNGRIRKGPFTLKNGAIYTGQWLNGMRDGDGS